MARKFKIKPAWIAFAVAFVVITAAGLLHVQLLTSRAKALVVLDAEIQQAVNANALAEQAISDLPALKAAVQRFAGQVPPDADLGPLLESIGADLAGDGMAAGGMAPQREIATKPTVAGHPVARTPFSLQYRGSFRGTVALLTRLQEGELLTRVERIIVEKGSTSPQGENPLKVQVDFSTFARTAKELEAWAHAQQ